MKRINKKMLAFLVVFTLVFITACNKDKTEIDPADNILAFNAISGIPFAGVQKGSIGIADIDGDNDLDVLITGESHGQQAISRLYTNDGSGFFEITFNIPFEGVERSSVAFADIDNDGDQDVLITGVSNNSGLISKLYENDGLGNFSEVLGTPFRPIYEGSVAFADVDSDGDQDLLITGWSGVSFSTLYTNDGTGVFQEVFNTPFVNVRASSIAFADVDGDNDLDVLITGLDQASSQAFSKLYFNDGSGNFTEANNTPFQAVYYGSIAFSDIDGDNDQDILITGLIIGADAVKVSKLYTNDGTGVFEEVANTPFEDVYQGSVAFADVDNDGDQDVLITGSPNDNTASVVFSKLYLNDGSGVFLEETNVSLDPVTASNIAFLDADNDGDKDLLITGFSNSGPSSKLFIND